MSGDYRPWHADHKPRPDHPYPDVIDHDEDPATPVLAPEDLALPTLVWAWAERAERAGADPRLVTRARELAEAMARWARTKERQARDVRAPE